MKADLYGEERMKAAKGRTRVFKNRLKYDLKSNQIICQKYDLKSQSNRHF
jgi:hypothetical protein